MFVSRATPLLVWIAVGTACGRLGYDGTPPAPTDGGPSRDGGVPMIRDAAPRRDAGPDLCDGSICAPPAPALLEVTEDAPTNFGAHAIGTTTPHPFVIENRGGSVATEIEVTTTGVAFAISDSTCTGSVAPGMACTVVVGFLPTAVRDELGSLDIRYHDGVDVRADGHALIGVGTAPEDVVISPSGVTLLAGSRLQLTATGGMPPYAFSLTSGSGTVSATGLVTAPGAADVMGVQVVDGLGTSVGTLFVVVEAFGTPDRMCMGELGSTLPSGVLTDSNNDTSGDGDYENLEDCQYLIRPPSTAPIVLTARAWNVELGGDYDWLEVLDGETAGSPRVGHYTGDAPLTTVTARSGSAYVHWQSDSGGKFPGYEIVWRVAWTADPVAVASPPVIEPGAETTIWVNGGTAPYSPSVAGGATLGAPTGNPYSFRILAPATPGDLVVRMTDVTGLGASVTVPVMAFHRTCTDSSTVDARGGLYDSGGRDAPYANGEDCLFMITRPAGTVITLTPHRFRIEGDGIFGFGPYDLLEVRDGPSDTSPLIGAFDGNDFHTPIVARSGSMSLRFRSDSGFTMPGYELVWE